MKLTDFDKTCLLTALENHKREKRAPINWRVGIRARFSQIPSELSTSDDKPLIQGFTETSWLNSTGKTEQLNLVSKAESNLRGFLQSRHIEDIEPARTTKIDPDVFMNLGYAFVTSRKKYSREETDKLLQEWQSKGLDCFIIPELGQGAALYELTAVELIPKFKKAMDTKNVPLNGPAGVIYGRIEDVIHEEALIKEARETVNQAFESLETEGLAVRVKGVHLCWNWNGLVLTREGVAVAEDLQFRLKMQSKEEKRPKLGIKYLVRCPGCTKIYYTTNDDFDPDRAVRGHDLDLLPEYQRMKWSKPFTNDAIGMNITCLCEQPLVGYNNLFLDGVLVDPADNADRSTGKIDDKKLLELVDEGKSQPKIAEIFGVTKQAVNKRLKYLQGEAE